ncbi:hypothetical protein ACFVVP_26645 [Streptomyces sp. NPDC058128]|uniref:hypothetical protein n=1 Tax=Streptomyces sp. NPDC058128 TaxID=3346352 RepID=UPI0036E66688
MMFGLFPEVVFIPALAVILIGRYSPNSSTCPRLRPVRDTNAAADEQGQAGGRVAEDWRAALAAGSSKTAGAFTSDTPVFTGPRPLPPVGC